MGSTMHIIRNCSWSSGNGCWYGQTLEKFKVNGTRQRMDPSLVRISR